MGNNIDGLLFRYFDMDGNEIPQSGPIPMGGYTLTAGQRLRITAIELTIVVRSNNEEQVSHRNYVMLPDGRYWYDNYHREVYRFMVRGRNLNLDAS